MIWDSRLLLKAEMTHEAMDYTGPIAPQVDGFVTQDQVKEVRSNDYSNGTSLTDLVALREPDQE